MHQFIGSDDFPSKCLSNTLVTEAYTQHGSYPCPRLHCRKADAGMIRVTRPRGNDQTTIMGRFDCGQFNLVVSQDIARRSKFTKVLHQIIGEGVIVIYDKQFHLNCLSLVSRCSPVCGHAPLAGAHLNG